ncbi:hypothetical protein Tco_1220449, partial [Tanacetum coccineum]
ATEISQSSGPTTLVADETVHEEKGDSVERAATTATGLDADLGGSSRRQDTILRDTPAQTRFERLSKQSNNPPFSRVNTLKRFKKLEKKKNSRTPQLKRRLFKVRKKSSAEKSLGDQEDSSKQGRNEIDQDEGILWFQEDSEIQGRYGHDIRVNTAITSITTASINITTVEPITTASAPVTTAGVSVSNTEPSTPSTTTTTTPIEDEYFTIAQTLMKMKTQRLQAELDEEARLEREREKEASKAVNIAEWEVVQAMMDADYELATKLQAEEQGEISIE